MKAGVAAAVAVVGITLVVSLPLPVLAQQVLPGCNGPTKVMKDRKGKEHVFCLDGKYSSCLRDSQKLGTPYAAAKRHCDQRKAAGAVK